jgi:NADH-quinone oxidoreductase subunit K
MVPIWQYLVLSATLFVIGAIGVVVRRNLVVIFMCIELMLNAVNLTFIAFARLHGGVEGQVIVFLVIVLAAALHRRRQSLNVDEFRLLKG